MRIKTNGIAQSIDQSFSETQLLPSYIGDNTARLYATFTPDAAAGGTFADAATAEPVTAKTKDGYLICEYLPINTDIDIEPYYEYEYTVRYLELGTNTPLASEKVELKEANKSVTERAIIIGGYRAIEPTEQIFMLDSDGKVITFYYEKLLLTTYTVKYLDVDDKKPLYPDKRIGDCEVGSMVSENAIAVSGYTALAPTEVSLVLAESGNVIIFYYEREPVLTSYTVRYLDVATDCDIAGPKIVTDVPVGMTVAEYAVEVWGYTPLNLKITFTLKESGNEVCFYYVLEEY